MLRSRAFLVCSIVCALTHLGCARGLVEEPDTGHVTIADSGVRPDVPIDAGGGGGFDAGGGGFDAGGGGFDAGGGGGFDAGLDAGTAPIDTGVDAPVMMPDVPVCTPSTMQILVNPNLDASPLGTGWSQVPFDPLYPPITDDPPPGLAWQTGSAGIWLSGFDDATDSASQAVTIPAGTNRLVLRFYYAIGTEETTTSTVYDTARVALVSASGAVLEPVITVSNVTVAPSWTLFTYMFTNPRPGESVRLRFDSDSDFSNPTSFVFDTISLEATVACP